jgi:hypothetical protein
LLSPSPSQFEKGGKDHAEVWPWGAENDKTSITDLALKAAGLLATEVLIAPIIGTLFDVNQAELTSGPFRLKSTDEPAEHLTFEGAQNHRILRILSVDKFFKLIRVEVSGAARYVQDYESGLTISSAGGFPRFYKELFLTYVLLFGGDDKDPEIGKSDVVLLPDFVAHLRAYRKEEPNILSLQSFLVYGTRLRTIQDTLEKWRPRSIAQLAVRPYHDPLSYYAFWAVILFGFIGLLGLATSVIQAVGSFKGTNVTILVHANGTVTPL